MTPLKKRDDDRNWIPRKIEADLLRHLDRKKSILLLGPRQTGKTSLLSRVSFDLSINLLSSRERLRFEKNPDQLVSEIDALESVGTLPLVLVDEVQKVPALMDVVQYLVDQHKAQFVLTGSSARKLKSIASINQLPGRVVVLRMDPLSIEEWSDRWCPKSLIESVNFGSLPGIVRSTVARDKEQDLASYVETYLEDEIRREAVVRNLVHFSRFLELAALESGKLVSFRKLSQDIGIAHTTVSAYFQILEDCLLVDRVDPLTESARRNKLVRSSRYLFFDLGVRRLAAGETPLQNHYQGPILGDWFEQWVGQELIRGIRNLPGAKLRFWKDPDGPEVDWVLVQGSRWIPIEVKLTATPDQHDARHLKVMLAEYPDRCKKAYIVCTTPRRFKITDAIEAIPWTDLPRLFL